jgi:hypothetical protein
MSFGSLRDDAAALSSTDVPPAQGPEIHPTTEEVPEQVTSKFSVDDFALYRIADDIGASDDLVNSFLQALGGDMDEDGRCSNFPATDLAYMLEADILETFNSLPLNPREKAKLRLLHSLAKDLVIKPAIVAPTSKAPPPTPPEARAGDVFHMYPLPNEEDDDSRKYEDYLEQGVQGTFKVLDKDDVTALRKNFERLMGGRPSSPPDPLRSSCAR